MTEATPGPEIAALSSRRLLTSVLVAIAVAALVLVTAVLPAEYGIDPTGIGRALGLSELGGDPTRTIEIVDVVGGNEEYRSVEIPEFGEPVPLPNPNVFQAADHPPEERTMQIEIDAGLQTEIKTVLSEGKMILYSWSVDRGDLYVDFHGHDPEVGNDFWVRYEEQQEGADGKGSLVAPFSGEHGWYWLNYNEFPVVITLNVVGYYDDIVDYGIF